MKIREKVSCGIVLLIFGFVSISTFLQVCISEACDVAVISGDYTKTGRPIIWKNRDHGPRWEQEVKYYPGKFEDIGGSVRVIDRSSTAPFIVPDENYPAILSGGVNEAGFAITNTTVYENDPLHEYYSNANHLLMENALETCRTVEDFDEILANFRTDPSNWDKIISGNFVVLDAEGGAALYEIFSGNGLTAYLNPLLINKFDANDLDDAPYGFVNRTNSHEWIQRNSDTQREVRGRQILTELFEEGEEFPGDDTKGFTFQNIIVRLSKDVCGDEMVDGLPPENPNKFNTRYCISRYMTNIALVVDGVLPYSNPELTTFWVTLGEPASGVTTPHFAATEEITPYAWAESGMETDVPVDVLTTCALNQAMNDCEIDGLYANNWDYGNIFIEMDRTIDYEQLLVVQEWSIPLEYKIMGNVETILDKYRNGDEDYSVEDLYELSHYAAKFAYNNYVARSDSAFLWDFGGVIDDGSDDGGPDPGDGDDDTDDNDDDVDDGGGNVASGFSAFILWLLEFFLNL